MLRQALRGVVLPMRGRRSVYVAMGDQLNRQGPRKSHRERLHAEEAELNSKVRELRVQEQQVRQFLKAKADERNQEQLALADRATTNAIASPDDLAAIESAINGPKDQEKLGLPRSRSAILRSPNKRQSLPASITALVAGSGAPTQLTAFSEPDWAGIVAALPGASVPAADVEKFVDAMPVAKRAALADALDAALTEKSQFLRDKLMEAYAFVARPADVERLLTASPHPTIFSFGHVAKAYFKTNQTDTVADVLRRIDAAGLQANLTVYTTVVQALVQDGQHKRALAVFDNLKYLSTATLPDTRLYNTAMLAAAKMHNPNKALDLFREMRERAIQPLEPDAASYHTLVYACAREPTRQLAAWDLLLEARDMAKNGRGGDGRAAIRALLYLCGRTGEAAIARALVRQLCARPETYVDSFGLNCLFQAYANFKPTQPSQVLGTHLGVRIRSSILLADVPASSEEDTQPPFLPMANVTRDAVLAESAGIMAFFARRRPDLLRNTNAASQSQFMGAPAIINYLRVAIAHGYSFEEFRHRYNEQTYASDTSLPASGQLVRLERNSDVYRLALAACTKFRDAAAGREVWEERGRWRRTPAFRNLSQAARNRSDAQFAMDLVALLARTGQAEEALSLAHSSNKLVNWNRHSLGPLIEVLEAAEDNASLARAHALMRLSRRVTRDTN